MLLKQIFFSLAFLIFLDIGFNLEVSYAVGKYVYVLKIILIVIAVCRGFKC